MLRRGKRRRRSGWRWFVVEELLKVATRVSEWSAAVSLWIGSGPASAFLNLNPTLPFTIVLTIPYFTLPYFTVLLRT